MGLIAILEMRLKAKKDSVLRKGKFLLNFAMKERNNFETSVSY